MDNFRIVKFENSIVGCMDKRCICNWYGQQRRQLKDIGRDIIFDEFDRSGGSKGS